MGQLSQTTDKSRGAAARVAAGSFAAPGRRRACAMERSEKDARGLYDAQGHRGAAKMGAVARAVTKRAAVAQIRVPQRPFLSRSMPQRRFLPHGDQRRRFPPHSRHTPAPGPARNKNRRARRLGGGDSWWRLRGSNPRPQACKARALPAELSPRLGGHSFLKNNRPSGDSANAGAAIAKKKVVGLTRFELVTSRLSAGRSDQLSYRPNARSYITRTPTLRQLLF